MNRSHISDTFNGRAPFSSASTHIQMKATKYDEFTGKSNTNIYDNLLSEEIFNEPDLIIRYYNYGGKIEKNCSFSLEGEPDPELYDFVTIVLRDIAKGLGITWRTKNMTSQGDLNINSNKLLPFETYIVSALGTTDPHEAGVNATKGTLHIGDNNQYNLYAPTIWDKERSLNYFIPETDKKITRLLCYDFGRGSVIRDISDEDTYSMFKELLEWRGAIAVGIHPNTDGVAPVGKTEGTIDYGGQISFSLPNKSMALTSTIPTTYPTTTTTSTYNETFNLNKYIEKFFPCNDLGWCVSLLKSDGTWDAVYKEYSYNNLNINTDSLKIHDDIKNYARTCDGYLRCCITYCRYNITKHIKELIFNRSYVLDYLPQTVEMKLSKVMPTASRSNDYFRDVMIGMDNLEGADRIVVSQLDEGEEIPFFYDVPDFKNGYFIANVDKEYTTTFKVIAYNKNGNTTSDSYVLQPIEPATSIDVRFRKNDDTILVEAISDRLQNKNIIKSYEINNINMKQQSYTCNINKSGTTSNQININNLSSGLYILTVYDIKGGKHDFKFMKK